MPLYDYQCNNCEHVYEVFHALDGQPPPCPICTCPQVTRLISAVAFSTKGDGAAARVESEIKKRLGQGRAKDALTLANKAVHLAGKRPGMDKVKAARDKLASKLKKD